MLTLALALLDLTLALALDKTHYLVQRRSALNVFATFVIVPVPVVARNLPEETGASGNQRGLSSALVPIVQMRESIDRARKSIPDITQVQSILHDDLPKSERDFKRTFDEFSDAVSYKQRFLDSNAFLVYYTKGYDGPNRPSIEQDVNLRQTNQYGARNDAWNALDDARAEVTYLLENSDSDTADLQKYLASTVAAFDTYLSLVPQEVLAEANQLLLR